MIVALFQTAAVDVLAEPNRRVRNIDRRYIAMGAHARGGRFNA
jgi:hypothetical protein